jgi:hypothetical protein
MKVAIVGAAHSSRDLAPYTDPTWLIWTCSPSNRGAVPKVDAWFELHAMEDLGHPRWRDWVVPYFAYLKTLSCKVYMQEANNIITSAVAFPKDELIAEFGPHFFTSSIAWMIAFAIKEGAKEIAVFGVDMNAESEYSYERPGCQHFIRVARERGIEVTVPPQSDLDAPIPLYGYGDANPMALKLKAQAYELRGRIAALDERLNAISQERDHLTREKSHLQGALEQNVYMRRTFLSWSGPDL